MNMPTVSTGTVALAPRVHAMTGIIIAPVPKPATPPMDEATMAARPSASQPAGSGT